MSKQTFGGQKNPPWARANTQQQQPLQNLQGGTLLGNLTQQNILQYQQPQQVFAQNLGIQQPNLTLGLQQMQAQGLTASMNQPQIYPQMGTVAYPNPRAVNNQAFQTVQVPTQNTPVPSTKQRVFTGTVTKIHNDFGFVDEDVFFQTTACVKGSNPAMGDRVLVEASYNPSMPFKWNATRIQVLPVNNNANNRRENPPVHKGFSQSGSKYNAVPPPDISQNGNFGGNNNSRNNNVRKNNAPRRSDKDRKDKDDRHRDTEIEEVERRKRREERERERIAREKEREEKDKHSPSRRRSRSPKSRRRTRPVPRYMVQIPKIALDMPEADVLEVSRRYSNLYIPSDFFKTHMTWVEAFPPDVPFTLTRPCSFHVMHKDVEPLDSPNDLQDPTDADYLFSAKVMLMSMPTMEEVFRKCCSLADDGNGDSGNSEDPTFVHPTRLINFLVGLRGKNETMAIGGPWSPSLDGPNPDKNPSVLIKTAIRTCKSLTGIDLSSCTQWYRFVELYYRRAVGKGSGARVETVVVFLPDVWSCLPTRLEWDALSDGYRRQLVLLNSCSGGKEEAKADADAEDAKADVNASDADDQAQAAVPNSNITDESCGLNPGEPKREPTHFSELDPKTMKVQDLRAELDARSMISKGLKSQLIARLVKAIKAEADKVDREDEDECEASGQTEDSSATGGGCDDATATSATGDQKMTDIDEREINRTASASVGGDGDRKKKYSDESRKTDDKERALLEKRYTLPDSPHIVVHPSKVAKSGKFDCTVMSLSLLLDYRPEDTKEHSFEVSLFAELFNEMLMRDFGFNIYKSLYVQPEKPKEEPNKKATESGKKSEESSKKTSDGDKSESKCGKSDDRKSDRKSSLDAANDEDYDDDDRSTDGRSGRSKGARKPKMTTKDPNLLLSFVYFDQTHCGYIFEKDVEELLYTLGLNLSRAQVRKMVSKVVSRNSLHYRKLTDKPKDEPCPKATSTESSTENKSDATDVKPDVKHLASGNKRFLPVFGSNSGDEPSAKRVKTDDDSDGDSKEGFVMYKGGLLDIEKLMAQMRRSEKARADTEEHLVEIKQKNNELLTENSRANASIKELNDKLSDYRTKLSTCEKEVKEVTLKSDTFHTLVRTIQCTINNTMEKFNKTDEKHDKNHKSTDEKTGNRYNKSEDKTSKCPEDKIKFEDKTKTEENSKTSECVNKAAENSDSKAAEVVVNQEVPVMKTEKMESEEELRMEENTVLIKQEGNTTS